jgi:ribosomal protein S18 acetylase RimI-like enzyme
VIGELMKAIARNGGRTLQLNVNRNNPARGFYERMGFSVIREEDIDIGQNFYMNDYVMERTVQNAVG